MRAASPWRMLALLAVAELLGMSLWFAGSAVAPQLQVQFQLSGNAVGALTTAVQLGFVLGTALSALLNLADVVPARLLFAVSALLGALANSTMAFAPGYTELFVGRFATGVFLAGVYPPAMKMASTWFKERRGLAVGTVVGALTVGKAGPYLVHVIPAATPGGVSLFASASAIVGLHSPHAPSVGRSFATSCASGAGDSQPPDISGTWLSCIRTGRGSRRSLRQVSLATRTRSQRLRRPE
jgi:MFS family permease